jgi:hypothetical protein
MPNYICEKCNKNFTKKSAYLSHMMRTKTCIKDTNINNECMYCNKKYSTRFNLNSHLNICKKKADNYNQIDELKKLFDFIINLSIDNDKSNIYNMNIINNFIFSIL